MTTTLYDQLTTFYKSRNYNNVISKAIELDINPSNDPLCANIVAASLFQLSKFDDCLMWCEGLAASYEGNSGFASMHGATLRRLNRLSEASSVFEKALVENPDDPALLNNYANLLIDLKNYDKANGILRSLLEIYPDYEDAKVNLDRVAFFLDNLNEHDSSSPSSASLNKLSILDDPLAFAFSDDEISKAGGLPKIESKKNLNASSKFIDSLSLDTLASRDANKELQEFVDLIRSTASHNVSQALTDLCAMHKTHGTSPFIHELAVEIYLKAQKFDQAERYSLIALQLGSKSPSLFLNLANLSYIRGDELLAMYWLEHVSTNFPDCEQLESVKNRLVSNGIPKKSSNPFPLI